MISMKIIKDSVTINSALLADAIKKSPFNYLNINKYLNRGPSYINDVINRRDKINRDDLLKVCELINVDIDEIIIDEYELRETKPLTARNDATQNWMINLYRVVEDIKDSVDNADVIAVIKGVRNAIAEQTAVIKEMKQLMIETKDVVNALKSSDNCANQECKKLDEYASY